MIKMKFGLLLIMLAIASENQENKVKPIKSEETFNQTNAEHLILVKIEEDEYTKANKKTSNYFGVSYSESKAKWYASRRSKKEKKTVHNGSYKDEETAAHASDTLARKLVAIGEKNHKLNFPNDHTEVFPKKTRMSKYIGVSYNESRKTWNAHRWSKSENRTVHNGTYKDDETAAHASDTLARKFMTNGEQKLKLNFPDDHTEVFPEEKITSSNYIGVYYIESWKTWSAQRWSKSESKNICNGTYKDEETAAYASDTLAKKLMANGEKNHKLNFLDDFTENQKNKRKRSVHKDMEDFQNK